MRVLKLFMVAFDVFATAAMADTKRAHATLFELNKIAFAADPRVRSTGC